MDSYLCLDRIKTSSISANLPLVNTWSFSPGKRVNHRILNFSTTMSAPDQPMQPVNIQESGHSHGNKWNHGLFNCFSPGDICKLLAPALPFIPTITCGEHL